jgi:NAD(P)-dependent dehydrogenase (short-subunit alcohol dehydrogenase family)
MTAETGSGRVRGKVALITGTARGMGVTHAQVLAREGAKIIMTDISEGRRADRRRDRW